MTHRLNQPTAYLCTLLSTFVAATAVAADAQPLLEVTLASGRTFVGAVHSTTDEAALVLRFGDASAWLTRSIAWNRIASARQAGAEVPRAELPALAERLKSEAPARAPLLTSQEANLANDAAPPAEILPAESLVEVSALSFDAFLANWDADVEADGLVIFLQSTDPWGQLVSCRGTVEIELFAQQRRVFHHAPQSSGVSLAMISRWTTTVEHADFGPRGAALRFPFTGPHPEFDERLGHYGLVHVRLSVPGSGVFEDSRDAVRIRPWAPLRDDLQWNTGRRFVPTERTGRSKGAYTGGP